MQTNRAARLGTSFLSTLKSRGPLRTLQSVADVVEDLWFERRHGLRTAGSIMVDKLDHDGPSKDEAKEYEPTKVGHLRRVLATIPAERPSLVDYGCGKGRVLFVAHQLGFERVVGVELSTQLVDAARENTETYGDLDGRPIEIVHGDAAKFEPRADQNVFFFYNPFGPGVMTQVLKQIQKSVLSDPRPIWIVYCDPKHRETIDEMDGFVCEREFHWGAVCSLVYRTCEQPCPSLA